MGLAFFLLFFWVFLLVLGGGWDVFCFLPILMPHFPRNQEAQRALLTDVVWQAPVQAQYKKQDSDYCWNVNINLNPQCHLFLKHGT